ncbi:MAG: hypothetical protein JWM42_2559 [Burkholderia sp.]|nr:hypothetical protein [Burkholderia sp.]
MADANRGTPFVNGIIFIAMPPDGQGGSIRDDEIAYEQLLNCDSYAGTATALIRAGIIEEHMLPGQPGRGKNIALIEGPDGKRWAVGYIEISRKSARLYDVKTGIPGAECVRRELAQQSLLQADQSAKQVEAAQQRESMELSELPRSHDQYREACVKTLRAHLNIVRDTALAANRFSGYQFDTAALREFDKAAIELLKTLYRGGTVYDPALQERRIVEIKSQSSRLNMPLQNFLQSLSAQTDGAEESTN